jgi:hypothetical protein
VTANERGEHFGDGGAIVGGVVGDALQGVDAAEPHVQHGMAELVDGAGEPLGDLALTACLKLPVGEVGTKQDHRPADALQQGGAHIVDGLRLVGDGERAR